MRIAVSLGFALICYLPVFGQANIKVEPVFPLKVEWRVGDASGEIVGEAGEVPAGDIQLNVLPKSTGGWYQIVRVFQNGKEVGAGLQRVKLTAAKGDEIRIFAVQPTAPWNAVILPIKGEWVMVTLARPWANFDLEKLETGEWKREEEFPNTALCWAKYGDDGMAKELAEHFCTQRVKEPQLWDFRGLRHSSIVVPLKDGKITPVLREISANDLAKELTQAFVLLRKQRPPLGLSVQGEIDAAKLWLQKQKS